MSELIISIAHAPDKSQRDGPGKKRKGKGKEKAEDAKKTKETGKGKQRETRERHGYRLDDADLV